MKPIKECTYCDKEWLDNPDCDVNLYPVHLDPHLADIVLHLNIAILCNRVLDADELSCFSSFGQHESLTGRINGLLEQYKDGLAVFKELIQNADDAGATEVKFLWDERENKDAHAKLIRPEMSTLQGPALWAFNDAQFSNEDFDNLVKLGGATKKENRNKIGCFGLGFNVVFNLTDVPSLVSQNYIVFLDPHTKYLNQAIRDRHNPGVKLDFIRNNQPLSYYKDQFMPFNGIFGCDFSDTSNITPFNGTLFRFPLRTQTQSQTSEILKKHYDHDEVRKLLDFLDTAADHVLLFTQSVRSVSLYHLGNDESPTHVKLMSNISKHVERVIRPLSHTAENPFAVLREADILMNEYRETAQVQKMQSSLVTRMSCTFENSAANTDYYWLVTNCMGNEQSLEMSVKVTDKKLIPVAGVAARLEHSANGAYQPLSLVSCDTGRTSKLFCFLPLPIHRPTLLPVHVNGFFAIESSRMHLVTESTDNKQDVTSAWNRMLMTDAAAFAYVTLLADIVKVCRESPPYCIWPANCSVNDDDIIFGLVDSVYATICSDAGPDVFYDNHASFSLDRCSLLEPNFRRSSIGDAAQIAFRLVAPSDRHTVDLPNGVVDTILSTAAREKLLERAVTRSKFYTDWFMIHIDKCKDQSTDRDNLVRSALFDNELSQLLNVYDCVPVKPHGTLRKADRLIHPHSDIAPLFDDNEERFPAWDATIGEVELVYEKLKCLGMKYDSLSWTEIEDRCPAVTRSAELFSKRLSIIIRLMTTSLTSTATSVSSLTDGDRDTIIRIREIRFLPVLQKPPDWSLPWSGDDHDKYTSCVEAYLSKKKFLVGCSFPIIDEMNSFKNEHSDLKVQLQILDKPVDCLTALTQLECVRQLAGTDHTDQTAIIANIHTVCKELYRFFDKELGLKDKQSIVAELAQKPTILQQNSTVLLLPDKCAKYLPAGLAAESLMPYLYAIPREMARDYPCLMQAIGIKEHFDCKDFIDVLTAISEESGQSPLTQEKLSITLNVINECLPDRCQIPPDSLVYIPNTSGTMCDYRNLCFKYCDAPMMDIADIPICHQKLTPSAAKRLGIKPVQHEYFERHTEELGEEFGQEERLTNRLKKILDGYPCGIEILKEMLQNADDAGATEIHFINDKRYLPSNNVFADSWRLVQGPALCVYNNKPFTQSDIKGICKLGEGNRCNDPTTTGQFGVGFNCVYHVTDVPTFFTHVDNTERLCIFDPHCKFIPGASERNRGRMMFVNQEMRKAYSDVFVGYLENLYGQENGTLFRLPLRTPEMARDSEISSNAFTSENIDELFATFETDMNENLLFLKNVREIHIKTVDKKSGDVSTVYWVKSEMSSSADNDRAEYLDYVRQCAAKGKELNFGEISMKEINYELTAKDSSGIVDKWTMIQRFGFVDPTNVCDSIRTAQAEGKIRLLPQGGVAYRMKSNRPVLPKRRLYCFLPLPLPIDMPSHLNGHFALHGDSRRNLWYDDRGGFKADWNTCLMEHVIAPAFCTLILKLKSQIQSIDDDALMSKYWKCFPEHLHTGEAGYFVKQMTLSLYAKLDSDSVKVLPLHQRTGDYDIRWVGPLTTGLNKNPVYFDDLLATCPDSHDLVQRVIVDCGFLLIKSPLDIYDKFNNANVPVRMILPDVVLQFFVDNRSSTTMCEQQLQGKIDNTVFKTMDTIVALLEYCARAPNYKAQLQGVSFLVTGDEHVTSFDRVG